MQPVREEGRPRPPSLTLEYQMPILDIRVPTGDEVGRCARCGGCHRHSAACLPVLSHGAAQPGLHRAEYAQTARVSGERGKGRRRWAHRRPCSPRRGDRRNPPESKFCRNGGDGWRPRRRSVSCKPVTRWFVRILVGCTREAISKRGGTRPPRSFCHPMTGTAAIVLIQRLAELHPARCKAAYKL
jgi:hypothetical protein